VKRESFTFYPDSLMTLTSSADWRESEAQRDTWSIFVELSENLVTPAV